MIKERFNQVGICLAALWLAGCSSRSVPTLPKTSKGSGADTVIASTTPTPSSAVSGPTPLPGGVVVATPTKAPEGTTAPVATPPVFNGPINLKTDNICSTRATYQTMSNLRLAGSNTVLKIASPTGKVFPIDASQISGNLRSGINNDSRVSFRATGIPDGQYNIVLCDSSQPNCKLGAPSMLMGGDVDSMFSVPGLLGYSQNFTVKNGLVQHLEPMRVLYDSSRDANFDALEALHGGSHESSAERRGLDDPEWDQCDEVDYCPLIISVSGKLDLASREKSPFTFDIDGDGNKDTLPSLSSEDAYFLVYDKDNDGRVQGIDELFGDRTKGPDHKGSDNGFLSLAKYDSDGNGIIDEKDPIFAKLQLWRDSNRDSVSQASELQSLVHFGIRSISLRYDSVAEDVSGRGRIKQKAKATFSDGHTADVFDLWYSL